MWKPVKMVDTDSAIKLEEEKAVLKICYLDLVTE